VNTEIDMETHPNTRQEMISALMDGQLSGPALADALQDAGSAEAREDWLVYHLVGDVLRCPDLARGVHDFAFAKQVSQRLQAPAAAGLADGRVAQVASVAAGQRAAANDAVFRWKMAAGLASVVAVAAIGWVALGDLRPAPEGQPMRLAQAPAAQVVALADAGASAPALAASAQADAQVAAQSAEPSAEQSSEQLADGQPVMLRDPQLDEMLAAHRATTGAWALGGAAGFLRNATYEGADR